MGTIQGLQKYTEKCKKESNFYSMFNQVVYEKSFKKCDRCNYECNLRRKGSFCLMEESIFWEVVHDLRKEMESLNIEIKFSHKLLIQQTAMLIIRLRRAQYEESNEYLLEWKNYHLDYAREDRHLFDIHYIERLEKRLIKHLKLLDLLPEQIISREKIKVVEKLKQQLFKMENKDQSYEVDAVCERETKL